MKSKSSAAVKPKNSAKRKSAVRHWINKWSLMKATWYATIRASASSKADAQVPTVLPYAASIKTCRHQRGRTRHKQKAGRLKHSKNCSAHTATSMPTATLPNPKTSRKLPSTKARTRSNPAAAHWAVPSTIKPNPQATMFPKKKPYHLGIKRRLYRTQQPKNSAA